MIGLYRERISRLEKDIVLIESCFLHTEVIGLYRERISRLEKDIVLIESVVFSIQK